MEYLNSLKTLYSFNDIQLESLKNKLKINIFPNNVDNVKSQLNNLMVQQTSIKNRIPQHKFNVINNFIIEIYSYVNEFENNSKNVNKVFDQSNYNLDTSILNQPNINRQIPELNNQTQYGINNRIPLPINSRLKTSNNVIDNIDPYKLYGIEKNSKINLDDLKSKYKKYALQTHPDKNNGETKNFNIITEAFKVLYEEYKLKQHDKQFNELKSNSTSFIENQNRTHKKNINFSQDNFNVNKFNKVYEDNRIENVHDDGYGDWSKSNKFDSEDIVKDNKLNTGNFNTMFDSNIKMSNNIIKYRNPRELFMNNENNCEELGATKIDNYTGQTKSINYTDYKEAHTTNRLVDTNINIKNYNSVNELKMERSNIKELTAEEIMEIELEKSKKEEYELKRQQNINNNDKAHFKNYNKIHNIMLSRR